MIKGIFDLASSMMPRLVKQDLISNNLANADSVGFKRDRVFIEAVKQEIAKYIGTDYDWQEPRIENPYIDFSQEVIEKTDNPLDVAIDGRGFFAVETDRGIRYTRNGQFHLDTNGTLMDIHGNIVLSEAGPIALDSDRPVIDSKGNISVNGEPAARLRVVDFRDLQALSKESGLLFSAPEGEETIPATDFTLRQGFVEPSNVSILDQMVDMLISYRNFETSQKSIAIQDETLEHSINRIGRTL